MNGFQISYSELIQDEVMFVEVGPSNTDFLVGDINITHFFCILIICKQNNGDVRGSSNRYIVVKVIMNQRIDRSRTSSNWNTTNNIIHNSLNNVPSFRIIEINVSIWI